jgi:hypothetical protein
MQDQVQYDSVRGGCTQEAGVGRRDADAIRLQQPLSTIKAPARRQTAGRVEALIVMVAVAEQLVWEAGMLMPSGLSSR